MRSDARKRLTPDSIIIPLPWTRPPVSLNDRQHYRVKALAMATAKAEAAAAISQAEIAPIVGAEVTLHYRVADRRRCDPDNLAGALKAALDALVATGVLPRDDWVHVPAAHQRIHPPNGDPAAMWLELHSITTYQETT